MIKPLRSRHRMVIILLSIIVPILFIGALMVRQSSTVPTNPEVPVHQEEPVTP
ncbi:MAG: hypothetical protein AB8G77_19660 [Rhodothermales bacterium]